MEPYIGEIRIFPSTKVPAGWMDCSGQILNISSYSALYSVIETIYGGNGTTTFGIPDLKGMTPLGASQSHYSSNTDTSQTQKSASNEQYILGVNGGESSCSLSENQTPGHNHTLSGAVAPGSVPKLSNIPNSDGSSYLSNLVEKLSGGTASTCFAYINNNDDTSPPDKKDLAEEAISKTGNGSSTPHENMQPYLTLCYCICCNGIYPPRI